MNAISQNKTKPFQMIDLPQMKLHWLPTGKDDIKRTRVLFSRHAITSNENAFSSYILRSDQTSSGSRLIKSAFIKRNPFLFLRHALTSNENAFSSYDLRSDQTSSRSRLIKSVFIKRNPLLFLRHTIT